MALQARDGSGSLVYLAGKGDGTQGDPFRYAEENFLPFSWKATVDGTGYAKGDRLILKQESDETFRWYVLNKSGDISILGVGVKIPASDREELKTGYVPILYDLVGGSTNLEGLWDTSQSKIYPKDLSTPIEIGTSAGQAINLKAIDGLLIKSQDWIVVPFDGDAASGLSRRAIAREHVIQNSSAIVSLPFWTNASDALITAPSRSNLVRAESGYPQTIAIEYALNNNPNIFLSGYAVSLPGGGVDLYSDYGLTIHIAQGTGNTEAIAASIRPYNGNNAATDPTPQFLVFTDIYIEQTIELSGCKGIEILNQSGRELRYGWAMGQCLTPLASPIYSNEIVKYISDIYYTGIFCLAAADVPDPVTIFNAVTNAGSPSVGGVFTAVSQGQLISGAGIPNNTYIRALDKSKSIATLCDSTGAIVNATASSSTAQLNVSGAVVRVTHWA